MQEKESGKDGLQILRKKFFCSTNYGRYVENGTYKMEARPFAMEAAQGPEFKNAVREAMIGNDGIVNAYVKQVSKELDGILKKISRN